MFLISHQIDILRPFSTIWIQIKCALQAGGHWFESSRSHIEYQQVTTNMS